MSKIWFQRDEIILTFFRDVFCFSLCCSLRCKNMRIIPCRRTFCSVVFKSFEIRHNAVNCFFVLCTFSLVLVFCFLFSPPGQDALLFFCSWFEMRLYSKHITCDNIYSSSFLFFLIVARCIAYKKKKRATKRLKTKYTYQDGCHRPRHGRAATGIV